MNTFKLTAAFAVLALCGFSQPGTNPDALISIWSNYNAPEYNPNNPHWWDVQSSSCIGQASPWVLGGNSMSSNMPLSNIGTCDKYPFILKANNFESVFIQPSGYIGINNATPAAALDVVSPAGSHKGSLRIFGDDMGTIQSIGHMNMVYASNSDFIISEGNAFNNPVDHFTIHNGKVGIDESLPAEKLHVNGNTRIVGNLGVGAYPAQAKLHVVGGTMLDGHVGVAGPVPTETFKINDPGYAHLKVATHSANNVQISIENVSSGYAFSMDGATNTGHISSGATNLINFKPLSTVWPHKPQVWLGAKPTSNHTDFLFAVGGKIVAQSLYLTKNCGWADYVFASDYKLPELKDVESYYKANHHLPEIPTANEVETEGIDVVKMNILLLKKVEELTLYVVQQQKDIDALKKPAAGK